MVGGLRLEADARSLTQKGKFNNTNFAMWWWWWWWKWMRVIVHAVCAQRCTSVYRVIGAWQQESSQRPQRENGATVRASGLISKSFITPSLCYEHTRSTPGSGSQKS